MSNPNNDPARPADDAEARAFYETLRATGQLVDVGPGDDVSHLPARVTHVRYPDGTVKRIRMTGLGGH